MVGFNFIGVHLPLLQEYFDHQVMDDGTLTLKTKTDEHEIHQIALPHGVSLNVVIAIPFLDLNPIASSE